MRAGRADCPEESCAIVLSRVASNADERSAVDFLRELAHGAKGDLRQNLDEVVHDVELISDPSADVVQVLTESLARADPDPAGR
jgi:hypothetical protein